MKKTEVRVPDILSEAYNYEQPSAFSRGLKVEISAPASLIYISGTASVDKDGKSVYGGDFKAQAFKTFENITALLNSAGATWSRVPKNACQKIFFDVED